MTNISVLTKIEYFYTILVRKSGFTLAGDGHCKDWVYLPEGGYPAPLNESNPLYNANRTQECMNRCVDAADKNLTGHSGGDKNIRDLAFYVRKSDQHCACSSGACSTATLTTDPTFISYHIVTGKFEALMKSLMILSKIQSNTYLNRSHVMLLISR